MSSNEPSLYKAQEVEESIHSLKTILNGVHVSQL